MQPDIMHCMFSLVQTHALGGSKHALCIDDWSPNQITGRRGGQGRHSALNLSASQSLSSLLTAASLEGRAAKASYFNEEKCINLALACAQIERRVGEGALSESFFLIKDSIEEDCGLSRFVCRVSSIPPRSPLRAGEPLSAFCFTSSAEFTWGSGPAPWCCIQCNTSLWEPPCSGTKHWRKKTYDNSLILIPTFAVGGERGGHLFFTLLNTEDVLIP